MSNRLISVVSVQYEKIMDLINNPLLYNIGHLLGYLPILNGICNYQYLTSNADVLCTRKIMNAKAVGTELFDDNNTDYLYLYCLAGKAVLNYNNINATK